MPRWTEMTVSCGVQSCYKMQHSAAQIMYGGIGVLAAKETQLNQLKKCNYQTIRQSVGQFADFCTSERSSMVTPERIKTLLLSMLPIVSTRQTYAQQNK
jgi:ethanolamine utilization protein EutA (predicted chaperonin)